MSVDAKTPSVEVDQTHKYRMRISRLTIDKLGIKLYDKVSAVLAELIANAYDADAERVTITLPLNTMLATKAEGEIHDRGLEIRIQDDGHGMTADDVNEYYLNVGINRRAARGEVSPVKGRKVMGRKGIGKLAPFGICHEIEVITAGGGPNDAAFTTSHFVLRLNDIMSPSDQDYYPEPGALDGTRAEASGTTVILRQFDRRRVPEAEMLHRQLAARFGLRQDDWRVDAVDSADPSNSFTVGDELAIAVLEGTMTELDGRLIDLEDGTRLPVRGWVGYARDPYKDEAMAGIRIFARGKLVAQTRDFDIQPGFTGEFKMRSYIVGQLHADWLDEDEDLIRSDRQDIIWNSEKGEVLRLWGQSLVREIARSGEVSLTTRVWDEFVELSRLEERLEQAAPQDSELRDSVRRAAKLLVRRTDREAVRDREYVERIIGLAFSIGPHRSLLDALHDAASQSSTTLDIVVELFKRASVAEVYSLGQVARERVDAVKRLRELIGSQETLERELQVLLERAPWILHPDWTPLSRNQSLRKVREAFESWYGKNRGTEITTTAIGTHPSTRPDFILVSNEWVLEIVEIKRPNHSLTDAEMERAYRYLEDLRQFLGENAELGSVFREQRLTIVCDRTDFKNPLAEGAMRDPAVRIRTWEEVLASTTQAHEDFLQAIPEIQALAYEETPSEV
jgi:hypothetical protein